MLLIRLVNVLYASAHPYVRGKKLLRGTFGRVVEANDHPPQPTQVQVNEGVQREIESAHSLGEEPPLLCDVRKWRLYNDYDLPSPTVQELGCFMKAMISIRM